MRPSSYHTRLLLAAFLFCLVFAASEARQTEGEEIVEETVGPVNVTISYPESWMLCDSWVNLPGSNTWNRWVRAFFYFVGLIYTFFGIAIVADKFMLAIETITSTTRTINVEGDHAIEVTVWNETVANLTLLALGSSAPEILLSVIETCSTLGSKPGELGPSTIVGSAAFNLLVITAICVWAVPSSQPKKIKEFGVFIITACSSILAYVWMYIVLEVSSPNVVTLLEAFLTFAMFPVLVVLAFLQDVKCIIGQHRVLGAHDMQPTLGDGGDRAAVREAMAEMVRSQERHQHRRSTATTQAISIAGTARPFTSGTNRRLSGQVANLDVHALAAAAQQKIQAPQTLAKKRANYRHHAFRQFRSNSIYPEPSDPAHEILDIAEEKKQTQGPSFDVEHHKPKADAESWISFAAPEYSVMENAGCVTLMLERTGTLEKPASVYMHTEAITAVPGENYRETSGTILFPPHVKQVSVTIDVVDNVQYQPGLTFGVIATFPRGPAELGLYPKSIVNIIDDDVPGVIAFRLTTVEVADTADHVVLRVQRKYGSSGLVSVKYKTRDGSAKGGEHFKQTQGTCLFAHMETEKIIAVAILDCSVDEKKEFYVDLMDPEGGTTISPKEDACQITIATDEKVSKMVEEVMSKLRADRVKGNGDWSKQFYDALFPNGDPHDADWETPSTFDCIAHAVTVGLKIICAAVPPPKIMGGYPCFFGSLVMLMGFTAVVAEFASLFGCAIGFNSLITAITFVAMGTSVPDLFASRQAALCEDYADAAIGNVTGSNSVNVYLGLGLPWVIASIYYKAQDQPYRVQSAGLPFSVVVFSIMACGCIGLLMVQRFMFGGELGGRWKKVIALTMVCMWLTYLLLSIMKSEGII